MDGQTEQRDWDRDRCRIQVEKWKRKKGEKEEEKEERGGFKKGWREGGREREKWIKWHLSRAAITHFNFYPLIPKWEAIAFTAASQK